MPSNSTYDLTIYKRQTVLVYNSAGTFLDTWRDAPLLSGYKEALNSAPQQLVVQLPRTFDNYDEAGAGGLGSIGQGNIVQYWVYGPNLPSTGKLRYQGVIDSYAPKIDTDGSELLEVTITPYGSQIGDVGVVGSLQMGSATATTSASTIAAGTRTITVASASGLVQGAYIPIDTGVNLEYVTITTLAGTSLTAVFTKAHTATYSVGGLMDPVAMFLYFFNTTNSITGNTWTSPLTLNGSSLSTSAAAPTWYTWQDQSVYSIWQTILVMLANDTPNWFFRVNADKTITLNKTPVTAQNVFTIGQHLPALAYKKDWSNLRNYIARIGATTSVRATASGADLTTFGQRTDIARDKRITTNAQAQILANGALAIEDQLQFRGVYTVVDFRGDTMVGLGYDIESLAVGQSVQIVNPFFPASGSVQSSVIQLVGLSYNFDTVVMELANFAPSQDRSLSKLATQLQDFSVIPS